jgi:hypothetical protein
MQNHVTRIPPSLPHLPTRFSGMDTESQANRPTPLPALISEATPASAFSRPPATTFSQDKREQRPPRASTTNSSHHISPRRGGGGCTCTTPTDVTRTPRRGLGCTSTGATEKGAGTCSTGMTFLCPQSSRHTLSLRYSRCARPFVPNSLGWGTVSPRGCRWKRLKLSSFSFVVPMVPVKTSTFVVRDETFAPP